MALIHNSESFIPQALISGRNLGQTQPTKPVSQTELEVQLDRLAYALETVEATGRRLFDRLTPVTIPLPEGPNAACDLSASSPFGQAVASAAYRVSALNERLQRQIEALAV